MRLFPALTLSLILCGGFAAAPAQARNSIEEIRVSSTLDPNAVLITEVDVVFVFDEALALDFPATKSEWFSRKFMMSRSAGDAMEVVTIHAPQGFAYADLILPDNHGRAVRVLAFAQHQGQNDPALDLTDMLRPLVEIDNFGLLLTDRGPAVDGQ